jgi:hypothetical protein
MKPTMTVVDHVKLCKRHFPSTGATTLPGLYLGRAEAWRVDGDEGSENGPITETTLQTMKGDRE